MFINNKEDTKLLINKQDELALGTVKGICNYFNMMKSQYIQQGK